MNSRIVASRPTRPVTPLDRQHGRALHRFPRDADRVVEAPAVEAERRWHHDAEEAADEVAGGEPAEAEVQLLAGEQHLPADDIGDDTEELDEGREEHPRNEDREVERRSPPFQRSSTVIGTRCAPCFSTHTVSPRRRRQRYRTAVVRSRSSTCVGSPVGADVQRRAAGRCLAAGRLDEDRFALDRQRADLVAGQRQVLHRQLRAEEASLQCGRRTRVAPGLGR